ncbi:NHLP-related RiPP peptide [Coralloluteibacterium stylophorae]|uniref:NHLP-related RiPP peptide n=1 Tax=Coralloluteibacterium stylophorae TaxID=1776034 RepID=A0A8J8AWE7_9GAMM|nr:NHLP-related RiPP peptide [Coralloluteibacterium stylophorae]MBS7457469.1 NHLP-related RiPP peptide [Coralloluteibacterium stylophorae]
MQQNDKARELLERLAHDDDFRARFEADPISVLQSLGVEVNDEARRTLAAGERRLPSKEEIEGSLDQMAADLTSKMNYLPHCY